MNDATKQVIIAGVSAAVATTVGVLITHWLTKESTTQNIASGKTPLPADATPTFKPTEEPPKKDLPPKKEEPKKEEENLIAQAAQIARVISRKPPTCPTGYHWGGYDADNPNLPKCVPD